MKLATVRAGNGHRAAIVNDDDVAHLLPESTSVLDVIRSARRAPDPDGTTIPHADAEMVAPIPSPVRNVFCVGWNYLPHFAEGVGRREGQEVKEIPEFPTFFTKATTTVVGPYDDIPSHRTHTERLDWEAELAVFIGREGVDIPESEAMSYVFGYAVANDISARELQRRHGGQWMKGKSLDGTCPLGPFIVTADALSDPHALDVVTRVNGVVKQESNTEHMVFRIPRIISELSHGMTLVPGDVILTGTPEGTGFSRTPPEFLQPGDILETEIRGLGTLRNRIAAD